jgi:hypothetical protein
LLEIDRIPAAICCCLDEHMREKHPMRFTPDTWRIVGYVRDVLIILSIAFGALYLSWHPEKFDAFMYWLIGYRYRH